MKAGELNLASHRGPSIWERDDWNRPQRGFDWEPWALGLSGAGLLLYGLSSRRRAALVPMLMGSALAFRALTGARDLSTLGLRVERWLRHRGWRAQDVVHEASADSFPASDAPGWTPTTGHEPVRTE